MSEEKTGLELLFAEWLNKTAKDCTWRTQPPQIFCLFSGVPCNFWACFKRTLEELNRRKREAEKTDAEKKEEEARAITVKVSDGPSTISS